MFLDDIKTQALFTPTEEICGFVVRNDQGQVAAEQQPNIAQDKAQHFLISSEDTLKYVKAGNLLAYYHSHVNDAAVFSAQDMSTSDEFGYPLYLYSIPEDKLIAYVPIASRKKPVEGRLYLPLVYDCATAAQDFYLSRLGIDTPVFPRFYAGEQIVQEGLEDYFQRLGAVKVENVRQNDIIIMALGQPTPNHVGIYLGDTHFFHQVQPSTAKVEVYGGYWKKNTVAIYRHPHFR